MVLIIVTHHRLLESASPCPLCLPFCLTYSLRPLCPPVIFQPSETSHMLAVRVTVTEERGVSPAWLASLLLSTRISRPNIPLALTVERNTTCVYQHLAEHNQIYPATAGHETCPPRRPNISSTYTA